MENSWKEKGLTGYASIDKPWKKIHRKEPIRKFSTSQKLCTLIETANKDNLDSIAVNFMGYKGNVWSYRELFLLADQLADAYLKYGIKENDTVLVATVSGMDEVLNLLALNKIGAISKWIDITVSSPELETAINEDNCRIVVAFPVIIPELEKCIDKTCAETILYCSPEQFINIRKIFSNSVNDFKKLLQMRNSSPSLPEMPKDKRYMMFRDFLNTGNKKANIKPVQFKRDNPILKIQSSGTTGKPKSIVHTDYSINVSIQKLSCLDFPLYPQKVLLKTAPSWVGYGLINTLASGLAYGMTVLMSPMIGEDTLLTYNNMYDVAFAVPLHYRYLSAHISEIDDMSRPQALISGGDKISAQEIEEFQNEFATKGCHAPILNGAGNNEILGVGSVNFISMNKPGTIGIPLFNDIISIFDPETCNELHFGETGEICYNTESAFIEYANNAEKTNQIKKMHQDGKVWIHSNDLGLMDNDGFITIVGRLSRIITVAGFKISASQIEEVVQMHIAVKECVAVAIADKENGEVPMIHIALKDEYREKQMEVESEIKDLCSSHLKTKAVPKYYHFMDAIPYTSNNKQDFKKLEDIGHDLVKNGFFTK